MIGRSTPELLLEQLEAEGAERIRRYISDQTSEDLYLDFTIKEDPATDSLSIADRRNFAKALSGFANSDGGILIWGVYAARDEKAPDSPDVARNLAPLKDLRGFMARLNALVAELTKPAVPGARNLAIPETRGANIGFVASYVPVGDVPPYRAELDMHRYYKRSGGSFLEMEPYEVRDVIFRFRYPKIRVEFSYERLEMKQEVHIYSLRASLHNLGPTTLKNFMLTISLPEQVYDGGVELQELGRKRIEDVRYIELAVRPYPGWLVLFPGEARPVFAEPTGIGHPAFSQLRYKIDFELEDKGFISKHLYWTLYGDDMPPQTGRIMLSELTNF